MFDFIFSNSYIDVKYQGRLYLEESYDTLKRMMEDGSSTITVRVVDFTGLGSDTKTFNKEDISYYGSN
ncbi:MAG: hypothetical protein IJ223_03155 [Clostridia bacterium]|nr:hypothetical protein [Clostridia bacterium]